MRQQVEVERQEKAAPSWMGRIFGDDSAEDSDQFYD